MKLEIDNRKKAGYFTNTWKLNYAFMNNQEEIKRKEKKLETNENGKTYQSLKDTAKGRFFFVSNKCSIKD